MDSENKSNLEKLANLTQRPAEIHTSAEEAKKAEEKARQERMQDKQAEHHAHEEAKIIKSELEYKKTTK